MLTEDGLTEMQKVQRSLPIYQYKEKLQQLVNDNQVIVLVGETGSGKTT